MTSLSVVSIISQWPIWIVFHLLRWNILSKQKEEKPLISLYASATQRPRTSLEALLQSWNLNHLSRNEKALGGRSFKLYELKFIEYLEKKWKIACEQHEFHWQSFDRTLIRWISCNNSRSKVLKPVVFDAQTIARSSCNVIKLRISIVISSTDIHYVCWWDFYFLHSKKTDWFLPTKRLY